MISPFFLKDSDWEVKNALRKTEEKLLVFMSLLKISEDEGYVIYYID